MDLDNAVARHAQWKINLRSALGKREGVNADNIAKDNLCDVGIWLHGAAREQYGTLPQYITALHMHAAFHAEAAQVARRINARDYIAAERMLEPGTSYAAASKALTNAFLALKAEVAALSTA
jgi:methyl-accepting chemotaxis protein